MECTLRLIDFPPWLGATGSDAAELSGWRALASALMCSTRARSEATMLDTLMPAFLAPPSPMENGSLAGVAGAPKVGNARA
jgi:hypothetical protein